MTDLNERMAKVESDTQHIKETLDNHVMSALDKIWNEISAMCGTVKLNSYWIAIWRKIFWLILTGVIIGLIGTIFYFLRR